MGASLAMPRATSAQPVAVAQEGVDLVVVSGDAAEASAAEAVARDLLAPTDVALSVSHVARVDLTDIVTPRRGEAPTRALAHAWIDLAAHEAATLYLVDRRWERVLVRHFDRVGRSNPVVLEAVATALVTAIEALMAGGQIGVSTAEYGPANVPAPPSASRTLRIVPRPRPVPTGEWVETDAGYGIVGVADGIAAIHGPQVQVGAGVRPWPSLRLGGAFTASFRVPGSYQNSEVLLQMQSNVLRVTGVVAWRFWSRVSLRGEVGAGVDIVNYRPHSQGSNVVAANNFAVVSPLLSASVALRWDVARTVALGVVVGTDVDLLPGRLVLARSNSVDVVVRPWTLRPFAALTLGATWGDW